MATTTARWWRDVEIVLPVVMLAATAVYFAAAFQVSSPFSTDLVDASFVPQLMAGLMFFALLVVLRDAVRRPRAAGGAADPPIDLAAPNTVAARPFPYFPCFLTRGSNLPT